MSQENQPDKPDNNVPVHAKHLGRELAMEYLFSCEARDSDPGISDFELFLEEFSQDSEPEQAVEADAHTWRRAREYARRLYEAVTCSREELDRIIASHCDWDFSRLSAVDRNILRVAVAEMRDFPEVPPVVSIDEAVSIARDFGTESLGFINGLLNKVKDSDL